jgi:hypothetical protein
MQKTKGCRETKSSTGSFMAIGASFGILIGLLLFDGNIAIGLVSGMLLGSALGSIRDRLTVTPINTYPRTATGALAVLVLGFILGRSQAGILALVGAFFGMSFGMIVDTPGQSAVRPVLSAIVGSILGAGLGILAGLLHEWHAHVIGYDYSTLLSMPFIDDYVGTGAVLVAAFGVCFGMRHIHER